MPISHPLKPSGMAVNNLTPTNQQKGISGTTIPNLGLTVTGSPDQYFAATLTADPNTPQGLILTLSESAYIGIRASVEAGESGNPDRIKAQLYTHQDPPVNNYYFTLTLNDWTALNGFILSIDVYSYGSPSTYQGTFKFTKPGTKPPE